MKTLLDTVLDTCVLARICFVVDLLAACRLTEDCAVYRHAPLVVFCHTVVACPSIVLLRIERTPCQRKCVVCWKAYKLLLRAGTAHTRCFVSIR